MEAGIQSSFIPHDAGKPSAPRTISRGGLGDLVLIFAIVLFAASCALAGAVFLYQQYLQQQSTSDVAQLQRAENDFQPSLIQQLTTVNDRMQAAQQILAAHIAPTAFFDALDQVTLQTISYSSLTFDATDPQKIQVTAQGVAQDINAIAYQANLLSQSGVFSDPIFSNIQRQKDGVQFSLTMLVNPKSLNYETLTGGGQAQATTTPATGTPAPSGQPASSVFDQGANSAATSSASSTPAASGE